MRTLHLWPLLFVASTLACGEGDVGTEVPPFDEQRPYIYSEQPGEPDEKAQTGPERPAGIGETKPLPFIESLPRPEAPDAPQVANACSYYYDYCVGCADHSACLNCWVDEGVTAEDACGGLFP
jgi:hypothetical protein